jgi:hypothetical protein
VRPRQSARRRVRSSPPTKHDESGRCAAPLPR